MRFPSLGLGFVLILALCSTISTARAADSSASLAPNPSYDFGTVKQGEKVSHCFALENHGTAPIKTVRIQLSLPDMTARVPESIAAGQAVPACIELGTSKLSLKVKAQALLVTNDPSQPQIPLLMTGLVKAPIDLVPMAAVFAAVWKGEGSQSTVTIVNNLPEPLQVRGLDVEGHDFNAQLQAEKPGEAYKLVVTVPSGLAPGSYTGAVYVNTDSAAYPRIRVPINILVKNEIYIFPSAVDFASVSLAQIHSNPAAAAGLAEWFLVKKHTGKFKITSITSDVPGLKIAKTPEGESKAFRVDVTLPERLEAGSLAGKIEVLTDDRAVPELVIPVTGHIQ